MQSHPFRILNNHPRQPANSPPKQGQAEQSQLLQAILVMNPTNRVSRRGEGGKGKQATRGIKKASNHSQETAYTLLITPMRLMRYFQLEDPASMIQMAMYLQTLCKLCMTKQKVKQRKEWLWQLCHKEAACQQPLPPWLQHLLFSSLCHRYPKDLPKGTMLFIKEWLP